MTNDMTFTIPEVVGATITEVRIERDSNAFIVLEDGRTIHIAFDWFYAVEVDAR